MAAFLSSTLPRCVPFPITRTCRWRVMFWRDWRHEATFPSTSMPAFGNAWTPIVRCRFSTTYGQGEQRLGKQRDHGVAWHLHGRPRLLAQSARSRYGSLRLYRRLDVGLALRARQRRVRDFA